MKKIITLAALAAATLFLLSGCDVLLEKLFLNDTWDGRGAVPLYELEQRP